MVICQHPVTVEKKTPPFFYTRRCENCMPCRITKRQMWTLRMLLEGLNWPYATFLTLTYAPENLPPDGLLSKRDIQLFLKRLRKSLDPHLIRFFICGEYGPRTLRPHYHGILWNMPPTEWTQDRVSRAWQKGFISISEANQSRAAYVASYVTKKHTDEGSGPVLPGPQWSLMSKRPGVGLCGATLIADAIQKARERQTKSISGNIHSSGRPSSACVITTKGSIKFGRKAFPLSGYLLKKTNEELQKRGQGEFQFDLEVPVHRMDDQKFLEWSTKRRQHAAIARNMAIRADRRSQI